MTAPVLADPIALTPEQAAESVGMSVRFIRAAYRSGALPVHYIGAKSPRIFPDDLRAYVAAAPTERPDPA